MGISIISEHLNLRGVLSNVSGFKCPEHEY
jgi:hypothetical protein